MGNRKILGNYDECLEVEHPDHHFTGQHCMITVNITVDVNEGTQMKDAVDHKQVHRVYISFSIEIYTIYTFILHSSEQRTFLVWCMCPLNLHS